MAVNGELPGDCLDDKKAEKGDGKRGVVVCGRGSACRSRRASLLEPMWEKRLAMPHGPLQWYTKPTSRRRQLFSYLFIHLQSKSTTQKRPYLDRYDFCTKYASVPSSMQPWPSLKHASNSKTIFLWSTQGQAVTDALHHHHHHPSCSDKITVSLPCDAPRPYPRP
jgi:hypothetical protein